VSGNWVVWSGVIRKMYLLTSTPLLPAWVKMVGWLARPRIGATATAVELDTGPKTIG